MSRDWYGWFGAGLAAGALDLSLWKTLVVFLGLSLMLEAAT